MACRLRGTLLFSLSIVYAKHPTPNVITMKTTYWIFFALFLFATSVFAATVPPGVANSADFTLDGTLEPDEIGVVQSALYNPTTDNFLVPDNALLPVDGPTRHAVHAVAVVEEPTSMLSNDVLLTPPKRFYVTAEALSENPIVVVQYNQRTNRSRQGPPKEEPKRETPDEVVQEKPSVPLTPEETLKRSIRSALAANTKRALTTQNNTPWNVLLMTLPYGADAMVYQPIANPDLRDKTKPVKGNYIYSIGTLCWNFPCAGKTMLRTDGKRVFARVGMGYQHRQGALLAMLAMSNIMPNYELKISGGAYTIGHLVASEKAAVSRGANMSQTLVGLSFYSEPDETWKNEMGESWTIEKVVTEELNRSIDQGSSDVTDWLLGLTAAVKLYEEEGKALRGPMALAKKQLGTYQEFVLSVQNENSLWHPKFFLYKGTSADAYETLYSSGHILRWLLASISDEQLKDPKITKAVTSLVATVNRIPSNVAAGSMTDHQLEGLAVSLHALAIYNQRAYGEGETVAVR